MKAESSCYLLNLSCSSCLQHACNSIPSACDCVLPLNVRYSGFFSPVVEVYFEVRLSTLFNTVQSSGRFTQFWCRPCSRAVIKLFTRVGKERKKAEEILSLLPYYYTRVSAHVWGKCAFSTCRNTDKKPCSFYLNKSLLFHKLSLSTRGYITILGDP